MDKLHIFEPRFDNEELEDEFQNFFTNYNLKPLFTNEHKATGISVTWVDAKSVVNSGGSYHNTLKEFSDFLTRANDNKMYEEATFRILYECNSFQSLIRNIKRHMEYMKTFRPEHEFNSWNIVWYSKVF